MREDHREYAMLSPIYCAALLATSVIVALLTVFAIDQLATPLFARAGRRTAS